MATWSNESKISSSWSNESKTSTGLTQQFLNIGSGFNLLIDDTNKLEIQSASSSGSWSDVSKS